MPGKQPQRKSRFQSLLALLLGGVVTFAATVAAAQPSKADQEQAFHLYESARNHFAANEYKEAIADLEAARKFDPTSPNLVFNLGRANEKLGEKDKALAYFKEYAAMVPAGSAEEKEAKEIIARLEKGEAAPVVTPAPVPEKKDATVDGGVRVMPSARTEPKSHFNEAEAAPEEEAPTAAVITPPPAEEEDEPMTTNDWLIPTLAATSGALLAGGVVFGVLALGKKADAEDARTQAEYDSASSSRTTFAVVSDVLVVGALAAGGVALYLWLTDSDEESATAESDAPVDTASEPGTEGDPADVVGDLRKHHRGQAAMKVAPWIAPGSSHFVLGLEGTM